MTDLSANLQSQQEAVAKALLDLEAGSASLAAVATTNEEISAAGIEENEHTALSFEVRAHIFLGRKREEGGGAAACGHRER